jgi:hypothetical protein
MTNRRKKRGPRPAGYRNPPAAAAPPRRSFLDSLFAPRLGDSDMPRIRTSVTRGVVTVAGSPILVIAPVLYLLLLWFVMIALGFQGPFAIFASALALPPIGTAFDSTVAPSIFGVQGAIFGIVGFLLARGVVLALLTAAVVEALDTGAVTRRSLGVAVRTLPVAMATSILGVAVLTIATFFGPLLGPGFGILVQVGGLVLGIYLFAYAPVIAAEEGRSMPDSLGRSARAARIPGTGALAMATLYVIPMIAVIVAPGKPGNLIAVNPTVGAWVFVLLVNFLHLAVLAAFAFRYLAIADDVPESAPRGRAGAARGRSGGPGGRR